MPRLDRLGSERVGVSELARSQPLLDNFEPPGTVRYGLSVLEAKYRAEQERDDECRSSAEGHQGRELEPDQRKAQLRWEPEPSAAHQRDDISASHRRVGERVALQRGRAMIFWEHLPVEAVWKHQMSAQELEKT